MGRTMQRRLVRKLDLEIALSKTVPHPSPKAHLEQYTIDPKAAAELLYIAAYVYDDIVGKTVIDLGCGTGRLAIGSVLLGARETTGIDIDKTATKTAWENAKNLGVKEKIQWVTTDITTIQGKFDTVLQNPPFGVQRRKADRKFLKEALKIGNHVYSLHKSSNKTKLTKKRKEHSSQFTPASPNPFLRRFIEKQGGETNAVYTMPLTIPHMFNFHRKQRHQFLVDLYVIEKKALS